MDTLDLGDKQGPGGFQLYLENSAAPLTGFIFALPLFIVYHAGLWWLNTFADLRWANAVDIAIADWLGKFGMAGPLLSFILVIVVFLTMHALAGKPWHWPPAYTWFLMIMESLLLALPVFVLSRLVVRLLDYLPLSAVDGSEGAISWRANMVLSCGAGVYEEFFFRILVMGALVLVFDKLLGVKSGWKFVAAAVIQALLFSAFHHLPDGTEAILELTQIRNKIPVFIFRTMAGVYFAFLYIERGFGIAAGAHAGYDLMVVLLEVFMPFGE